jgi:hypothetical protein
MALAVLSTCDGKFEVALTASLITCENPSVFLSKSNTLLSSKLFVEPSGKFTALLN